MYVSFIFFILIFFENISLKTGRNFSKLQAKERLLFASEIDAQKFDVIFGSIFMPTICLKEWYYSFAPTL